MTNGNDSANPQIITEEVAAAQSGGYMPDTYSFGGLTKREYFAGLAMQGILSGVVGKNIARNDPEHMEAFVAELSGRYADSLIEALNKEKP